MKFTATALLALAALAGASPAHVWHGGHGQLFGQSHGAGAGHGPDGLRGYGSSGPCNMSSERTSCFIPPRNATLANATSTSTPLPLSTGHTTPIHGYGNTSTPWAKNHARMPVPVNSHIGHN